MNRLKARQRSELGPKTKAAILTASPSVVNVITHDIPRDMSMMYGFELDCGTHKVLLSGCGIIIECHSSGVGNYEAIVLAPAFLFKRTNDVPPHQIKVEVCLAGGKLCKGELVVHDFHYNLAAVRIRLDSPLQCATLRCLDDVSSINTNGNCKRKVSDNAHPRFQLRPHSDLFKVTNKSSVIVLRRSYDPPHKFKYDHGVFRKSMFSYSCKELFFVHGGSYGGDHGGAVINLRGEVIGLMFYDCPFLPSNMITRWWNYYKIHKKICRPFVGVEIDNLPLGSAEFLQQFRKEFPDVGEGVVVRKVEEDTPASCSGVRQNDVIVKCDGKLVRSKMEFFQIVWDSAGKSVELKVLRASDGQELNLNMTIGDTAPETFYRWTVPKCNVIAVA